MPVTLKRAYEKAMPRDGRIHYWLKDLAPSTELRKWFHARPTMWPQFRDKYLQELRTPEASAALEQLYELANERKRVTLVFGSKDEEHNSAVVLKELLEGMRKPPSSSGPERAAAAPMRARARR